MERKINIVHYVLLVLSLGMVAGSMALHRGPSAFLSGGDPTQVTRPSLGVGARHGVPVQITTPAGTRWKYVDFNEGTSLAEFLNNMGEELFGKAAYAQSAPVGGPLAAPNRVGQALPLQDGLTPRVPNMVHLVARHHAGPAPTGLEYGGRTYKTVLEAQAAWDKDGTVYYDQWVHNLRTNAGINWQYGQMAGGTAAVCTYIALSNDSGTPAATDTAVASEITSNGLARAAGTPAHTSNATSYTLSYTFTATGAQSAQKAGMLNASSAGTLCFENTFTAVSMQTNDTLAVTWTINF